MDLDERDRNPFFWIIIHPRGDRSKIGTAQMCHATDYEMRDYALASEERFPTLEKAAVEGRAMAKRWNLEYEPDHDEVLAKLETEMGSDRREAVAYLGDFLNTDRGWREWHNFVNEWGLRALSDEAVVELARRWREYQER